MGGRMLQDDDSSGQPPLPEIAGYRLRRVLGMGGMSTIYLGEQLSLRREVAVKVMLPEALADEVGRRRFENEARTIARLEHPHIVGIHDVGRTRGGLPYYSMPYLPRGHLGQRELAGDQARVREILRALLSALAYAHARGVIHRDVKAENVLFDEAERPLLADFGIALRRGFGTRVTTAGLAVGSTAYMAPEQARGEEVDPRADLYSVGVLTWEMLTGQLPYNAGDALSMAVMHAQDPIPRLPNALRHWQGFIDKALAKSPGKRFRDAQQMLAAMEAVPVRDGRAGPPVAERARAAAERLRRVPVQGWIGLVLVVAAGIGLATRDVAEGPGFFRATSSAPGTTGRGGLAVPGALPGQPVVGNPDAAMLRAAPETTAERLIIEAEAQIEAGRLTAPEGDNASESLLAAWRANREHLRLGPTVDRLIGALGDEAARRIARGDTTAARGMGLRAGELAAATARSDGEAIAGAREAMAKAFERRLDAAATTFAREDAVAIANAAAASGIDPARAEGLQARARAIPKAGERIRDQGLAMVLVRNGDGMFAAATRPVSRAEYAAFASATRREETLCRERASLLRIVARRSWQTPGFDQSPGDPVVCVSWQDADAYANWLGRRNGRSYRLPTAQEARLLPPAGGSRPVSEWSVDCSGSCDTRVANGRSWRGETGPRPLEANRGHDDVGFRLVRNL
jgi:serine/threonine-protein kinase PpkA